METVEEGTLTVTVGVGNGSEVVLDCRSITFGTFTQSLSTTIFLSQPDMRDDEFSTFVLLVSSGPQTPMSRGTGADTGQ